MPYGGGVFPIERQRWLVDHARAAGRVDVSDAAGALGVAVETIRRDLDDLERRSLLKRVHGGAVPVEGVSFIAPFDMRSQQGSAEKARIAAVVTELIAEADAVYLDEGSTTQAVAEALAPGHLLNVVTPSLPIASLLLDRPRVSVVMVGGRVRASARAAADSWAETMLQDVVVDAAVIGANGVTVEHGATCPESNLAAVKSRAMSSARRRILACDSSKFGVDSFARFAAIDDFTDIVTDDAIAKPLATALRTRGVNVYLA